MLSSVGFIYYVHLKAAVRVSQLAGLKLFPVDKERAFVTAALARAALVILIDFRKLGGAAVLSLR